MEANRVGRREIERQLRQMGRQEMKAECRAAGKDSDSYLAGKERVIAELMKTELPEVSRGGTGEFIFSQLGLIRKSTWLLHGVWLFILFVCVMAGVFNKSHEAAYSLLSIMTPMLVVLSAQEVSRIYQRSMLEIECATKYSLQKVILLRLTLLGGADMIILIGTMLLLGQYTELSLLRMMLYGLTPFLVMCLGCLELMRNYRGEKLSILSIALAVLIAAITQVGMFLPVRIYASEKMYLWMLFLMGTAVLLLIEIKRLSERLKCLEEIMER